MSLLVSDANGAATRHLKKLYTYTLSLVGCSTGRLYLVWRRGVLTAIEYRKETCTGIQR